MREVTANVIVLTGWRHSPDEGTALIRFPTRHKHGCSLWNIYINHAVTWVTATHTLVHSSEMYQKRTKRRSNVPYNMRLCMSIWVWSGKHFNLQTVLSRNSRTKPFRCNQLEHHFYQNGATSIFSDVSIVQCQCPHQYHANPLSFVKNDLGRNVIFIFNSSKHNIQMQM